MPRIFGFDVETGRQILRAFDALGHWTERAFGEYKRAAHRLVRVAHKLRAGQTISDKSVLVGLVDQTSNSRANRWVPILYAGAQPGPFAALFESFQNYRIPGQCNSRASDFMASGPLPRITKNPWQLTGCWTSVATTEIRLLGSAPAQVRVQAWFFACSAAGIRGPSWPFGLRPVALGSLQRGNSTHARLAWPTNHG